MAEEIHNTNTKDATEETDNRATQETAQYYVLMPENMQTVNTYVPILLKEEWVKMVADHCFNRMEVSGETDAGTVLPMPPMYKEDTVVKTRFLMGALVKLYLRTGWEMDEPDRKFAADGSDEWLKWLIPVDEYDKWGRGHVFGQLDRLKQVKELKNICFDLLNDYKQLEKMLNAEIYARLIVMNDSATRQMVASQYALTPEGMKNATEELTAAKEALEVFQKEMKSAEEQS